MASRSRNSLSNAVAALSRPEYTGENRCWPCTVANLCILAVGVLAVWWRSPGVAALLAVVGVAAIGTRGYVVPYTPRFAPALLSRLPFDASKGSPERVDTGAVAHGETDGEAILEELVDAGVIRGETDLVLDGAFHEQWRATMEAAREADLVAELEATIPGVTGSAYTWQGDRWYSIESTGGDGSRSLSRQVALADVAAVRTMADYGIDRPVACHATRPLRQFLTACPECDGELTVRDDSCCGGFGPDGPTSVLACDACDSHVFVFSEE